MKIFQSLMISRFLFWGLMIVLLGACQLPLGMAPLPRLTPRPIPTAHNCNPLSVSNAAGISLLRQLTGDNQRRVVAVAFADNNQSLTSVHASTATEPGAIIVWDVAENKMHSQIPIVWIHPYLSRLSHTGNLLATADDRPDVVDQRRLEFPKRTHDYLVGIIDVWDITSGKLQKAIPELSQVLDLDISPDGSQLLTANFTGIVHLMSTDPTIMFGGQALLLQTATGIQTPVAVAFDIEEKTYAYANDDGEIGIRPIISELQSDHGIIIATSNRRDTGKPLAIRFDPSRKMLAVLRERSVEVHNLQTLWGSYLLAVQNHSLISNGDVIFSPNSELLVVMTSDGWQLLGKSDWKTLFDQRIEGLSSVVFSNDGCFLAIGTDNGAIQIWGIPG